MKILPCKKSLIFQKKFVSNNVVLKDEKPCQCSIFELEKDKDFDYFKKLQQETNWQKAQFLKEMDEDLARDLSFEKVYVLEVDDENCLGYICIDDYEDEKTNQIAYIESCPKYAGKNSKKEYKFIGSALLAFAVELTQKANYDKLTVPYVINNAKNFYLKCGFKKTGFVYKDEVELKSRKFNSFLRKYNRKTKANKLNLEI